MNFYIFIQFRLIIIISLSFYLLLILKFMFDSLIKIWYVLSFSIALYKSLYNKSNRRELYYELELKSSYMLYK